MKTLNKTLSLVLVLVMVLGLFGVASAADFKDKAEIENVEAVNTMAALNIINGKNGNVFDPTGTVTRAEMAKMICVALNGGKEPVLSTTANPTYSDIQGHWAAGYIEYCSTLGIVAGMGDGTFAPDATVTGSQAAKMMLVAMNYKADVFGFTGPAWETRVNVEANKAGLYADLDGLNASEALTRDNAAQLIYNGIEAPNMMRSWSQDASTGKITESYDLGGAESSIMATKFGLKKYVGIMEGDSNALGLAKKNQVRVRGAVGTDAVSVSTFTYSFADANNWIGEQVAVLFKDGATGTAKQVDDTDTIYSIINTGKTTTYTLLQAQMQDPGAELANGKIKFGDKYYSVAANATAADIVGVFNYGATNVNVTVADATADGYATAMSLAGTNNDGDLSAFEFALYITGTLAKSSVDTVKFICDDNGKIAKFYAMDTDYAKVSSLTTTTIQLEGQAAIKLEDCVGYEGIAVGDIVRFGTVYHPNTQITQIFGKATTIEGKVTGYKTVSGIPTIGIDGVWYTYNNDDTFTVSGYISAALTAGDIGKTVSLVLSGPVYGAYKVVAGTNSMGLVTFGGQNLGVNTAKVLVGDNTTYTVTEASGTTFPAAISGGAITNASSGMLYAFALSSENTKVVFGTAATVIADATNNDDIKHGFVKSDLTLRTVAGATYIVASDANVFLIKGTSAKAFKASEINSFSAVDGADLQIIVKDGKVVAFATEVANWPTAATTSSFYGYVTEVVNTAVNDSAATTITVWNGSESKDVTVAGTLAIVKGDFVKVPSAAAGAVIAQSDIEIELTDGPGTGNINYRDVKIKEFNSTTGILITTTEGITAGGVVGGGSDSSYVCNSDTVIIGVNSADKKGSTVNTPVPYTKVSGANYNNAVIVTEEQAAGVQLVKAIFIDENNAMMGIGTGANNVGALGGNTVAYSVAAPAITAPVTGTAAANYPATAFRVTADKTAANDNDTITFTITYIGDVTDADDTFTFTLTVGSGADNIVNASAGLTGIEPNKTWTCTADVNAANVVAPVIAIAATTAP